MKNFLGFLIVFITLVSFPQEGLWQPKGISGGFIQDFFKDKNLGYYYVFTDSGFYKSQNLIDWVPDSNGIWDFSVIESLWVPIDTSSSIYAVLTVDGVFAKNSAWGAYKYANANGLSDDSGTVYGYQQARHIGIYKEAGIFYVYLSLEGIGLFRRTFNPSDEANPWGTQWEKDTGYTYNPYITSISSIDGGTVIFVSTMDASTYGGNIFRKSASGGWSPVISPGTYTTLSKDPSLGNQKILAGTSSNGVYISTDGGQNFSLICSLNLDFGGWKSLSFTTSSGTTYALGSASNKVYYINPQDCNNLYTEYSYFMGDGNVVFLDDNLKAYIGTKGGGLLEFSSPNSKGKPIGVSGTNKILKNNVSDIVMSPSISRADTPPIIFASSETEGFYKCFKPQYCTRYFYLPWNGEVRTARGTSVASVPGYDEYGEVRYSGQETTIGPKTIYLGTRDYGLFRTDNGGASWRKIISFPVDSITGKEFEIVKVALAPDFNINDQSRQHIYVLTRDAKVFKSENGGLTWPPTPEIDFNTATEKVIGTDLVISPAYNSTQNPTQNVFAATSKGIYKRIWIANPAPGHFEWQQIFNIPTLKIALSPCFGFPDCLECQGQQNCDLEKTTILAGTTGGLYFSTNGGLNFYLLSGGNCPSDQDIITALSFHPRTDVQNINNRLLNYAVGQPFKSNATSLAKFLYIKYEIDHWVCADADPVQNPDEKIPGERINQIVFHPNFGQNSNFNLFVGHDFNGIYYNTHPPTTKWINVSGFYNVPEKINSIAECPDNIFADNPNKLVIVGTDDYGVMISFDSGESYFPLSEGFEYTDTQGKKFTLHNAEAVTCTGIYDPCFPLGNCPKHRLIASSSDCSNFDASNNCTSRIYKGTFWADFGSIQNVSRWSGSTIEGNSMDGHFITELRYCSQDLPVYASDYGYGVLYSNKTEPDGWGKIWHLDNSGDYPTDVTDLTCPNGQSGPSLRAGAGSTRPGRAGFIWGAQSGLGGGGLRTAMGTAKFKTSPSGSWQSCTGLSSSANWRAILMTSSENVLIGSYGTDTSLSEGIYRNSQDSTTCNTWESANMGFSSGDSPQITENYSKKIAGFAKVSNGILVAMQKGGLNNREGGVFFSDTDSDGLAWVPVNSGMSCTSNYEVYNGQYIYTGSTCSGVYQTDVISYTGYPTAYFTYEASSNPWYEGKFTFYDRSAGLPTGREWDFDGDNTIDASPSSRTYTYQFPFSFGYHSYNTKIISYQNSLSDTYQLSDDGKSNLEVVFTFIPKVEKVGGDIKIYWDRITSGGHSYVYNIYSSTSPQGTSATLLISINDGTSGSNYDCTTSLCWYQFTESSSEKYYRIKTTW